VIQRFDVTERDAQEWAQLLEDDNPLHSDPEALAARGIGRGIVNPGPANMGLLMTLLLQRFPGAHLAEFEARFVDVVLAPAAVEACITAEREESTPAGRVTFCELELRCADTVAVVAKARLHPASRPAGDLA
jgi:acyl dehydratase